MTSTSHPPTHRLTADNDVVARSPDRDTPDGADALDACVAAFEEAHARQGDADPAAFLPPADHPLHLPVLCELVRVDLELGWTRCRPTPLDDYRRRFPALFADADCTQAVAFEEYRLRRQAGERPAPAEYQAHFGVDTSDWPAPLNGSARAAESPEGTVRQPITPVELPSPTVMSPAVIEGAARDYAAFCRRTGNPAFAETSVRQFEEYCRSEPQRASRLAKALTRLPDVGDEFLGFRLIGELGSGAFG